MATMTSKLPTSDRPLISDPDLAIAVERMLAGLTGTKLSKAQASVRRVVTSGIQASFGGLLAAYRSAVEAAIGESLPSDEELAGVSVTEQKLPRGERPLIVDGSMAEAVENMLRPYSGVRLERAQEAVLRTLHSGAQGTFATIVAAYRTAIDAATGGKET